MSGRENKMGWFSRNKNEKINEPNQMSPIEAVTHLCAVIQIADGQADYKERVAWEKMIKNIFPEHSEKRADRFLSESFIILSKKNTSEKVNYAREILKRIKTLISSEQLEKLGPGIVDLIESDGIVMSSEMEIINLINSELSINIILNETI